MLKGGRSPGSAADSARSLRRDPPQACSSGIIGVTRQLFSTFASLHARSAMGGLAYGSYGATAAFVVVGLCAYLRH